MTFDVITIFPEFFTSILAHGLLKRAGEGGQVKIRLRDLRDFTDDRHRTVDDRPFGGGPGMVFKPEPVFRAVRAVHAESAPGPVVLLSPQGRVLDQALAERLAKHDQITLICGRYEGVDERVAAHLATDEISIGDYVLSGGELPAAVLMECVTRLVPAVLGNEESSRQESFVSRAGTAAPAGPAAGTASSGGVLDCPHYTRPVKFEDWSVPEILLSGNHEEIRRWRRRQALEKTWRMRPDLVARAVLDDQDRKMLAEIQRIGRLSD